MEREYQARARKVNEVVKEESLEDEDLKSEFVRLQNELNLLKSSQKPIPKQTIAGKHLKNIRSLDNLPHSAHLARKHSSRPSQTQAEKEQQRRSRKARNLRSQDFGFKSNKNRTQKPSREYQDEPSSSKLLTLKKSF